MENKPEILEVVKRFITLKKNGSVWIGKCPLHNEKSPSFTVHTAKDIYKCFGCGKGGDSVDFIMNLKGLNFNDSVKYLEDILNIELSHTEDYYSKFDNVPEIPTSYMPIEIIDKSLEQVLESTLYRFLRDMFGIGIEQAFQRYKVGAWSGHNNEAYYSVFWYIDSQNRLRSGKYIRYNENGRRNKDYNPTWEHSFKDKNGERYPGFNFVQCFFGEHLLSENINKPVAIVESEKTAIISSLFIDKYIWLACGSKNGLGKGKCSVLANRSVTLFPDLGAFDEWDIKAKEYGFNISDILERHASDEDKSKGFDLADFLLR